MIEDDAKAFIKFVKEHNLYDKLLEETDCGTGMYYIHNILTACDLSDDESLNWKPYKSNSMGKLNQIIEAMAKEKWRKDRGDGSGEMIAFINKHATIGEFITFFTTKNTYGGNVWSVRYADTILQEMSGLAETFCHEVLWPKLRERYIEDAVKSLENKVEQSFKVTIEPI